MFLVGLLITLLAIDAMFLVLIILVQKGKGSMGLGALGGGTQMLFGGSGGQDLFQKMTWILGTIFMAGSLILSVTWSKTASKSINVSQPIPARSMPQQTPVPANPAS